MGIKLRGRITFFDEDSAPADINGPSDLERVHKLPANVKIVGNINFCAPGNGEYFGCAWRPEPNGREKQRTVIVASKPSRPKGGWSWLYILAHEYGHTTGLPIGLTTNFNLMMCNVRAFHTQIDQYECDSFRAGRVPPPQPDQACPPNPNEYIGGQTA